jgi:hypothetical protein
MEPNTSIQSISLVASDPSLPYKSKPTGIKIVLPLASSLDPSKTILV